MARAGYMAAILSAGVDLQFTRALSFIQRAPVGVDAIRAQARHFHRGNLLEDLHAEGRAAGRPFSAAIC